MKVTVSLAVGDISTTVAVELEAETTGPTMYPANHSAQTIAAASASDLAAKAFAQAEAVVNRQVAAKAAAGVLPPATPEPPKAP